ncbi:MAG: ComEC/Rec2 family competence protein [Christiangramia sp.]|nr:ComEC/Rec2 family competence protein [Christiangramia sp.]
MKNLQFIFLRLCLYLIAGMLLAFYIDLDRELIFIGFGTALVLFIFSFFRARKKLFPDALFGIATFLLIFSLGFSSAYFSKPENQSRHYISHFLDPTDSPLVSGTISEELKPTRYSQRFILETENLISDNDISTVKGRILLNITSGSSQVNEIKPGNRVLLAWQPEELKKPLNPFQFDYAKYLKQLRIERQIEADASKIKIIGESNDIFSFSWQIKERIISALKEHNFTRDELAVFQALILGQRRDISDKLYKDYAAAGTIHILAISGLHIGILLLMLNFLLKPMERMRHGKLLKSILIIFLLWSFAFLTGLSASVIRAVCMFSFIAVGMQMNRKTSSLNSVFLSLFFLLLINPYFLFQVGFQLSYLAVLSIILFQPVIYNLIPTKTLILDYFWKLISVSLAAQIGVIPLSLFYFHQFPGLFLITNLFVIPFLGIILGLGILVIIRAMLGLLPEILVKLFSFILRSLNGFIEKIAGIDSAVISNIDLGLFQTLSLFLIILSPFLLLRKTDFVRICLFLIGILVFQAGTIYRKTSIPFNESIVFHQSRNSVIGKKIDRKLILHSADSIQKNLLNDYIRERKIDNISKREIPKILELSGKLSLVVDSCSNYNLSTFKPEVLILSRSPKVNLERLIEQLQPELIIADGNNFKSYIEFWRRTSEDKKIPFHYTGEKGAYIFRK